MKYELRACARCNQDLVYVMKDCESGELYLHCPECEWTWSEPDQVSDVMNGRYRLEVRGVFADAADIKHKGWDIAMFTPET